MSKFHKKIRVWKVQLEGFSGPCYHNSQKTALAEIGELLQEDDIGQVVTVEQDEMTQLAFDQLQEFEGY